MRKGASVTPGAPRSRTAAMTHAPRSVVTRNDLVRPRHRGAFPRAPENAGALWSRDGGGGLSLGLGGLGLPHGVGVIDLGPGLDVMLLRLGDHPLGLLDQALGLGGELHRLGLLDGVFSRLDLDRAVPRERRARRHGE